jgi:hypothetical protein
MCVCMRVCNSRLRQRRSRHTTFLAVAMYGRRMASYPQPICPAEIWIDFSRRRWGWPLDNTLCGCGHSVSADTSSPHTHRYTHVSTSQRKRTSARSCILISSAALMKVSMRASRAGRFASGCDGTADERSSIPSI